MPVRNPARLLAFCLAVIVEWRRIVRLAILTSSLGESDMDGNIWVLLTAVVLTAAGALLIWRPIRGAWREARFAEARRDFHRQRERLEAKFVQLVVMNTKSDTPRWVDCQFDDDVAYAVDHPLPRGYGSILDVERYTDRDSFYSGDLHNDPPP